MEKIEYLKGQTINGFIFLGNTESAFDPDGRVRRKGLFVCVLCGNQFSTRIQDLKNGRVTSCGCYKKEIGRIRLTKHGLKNNVVYNTWRNIIGRCYEKNNPSYKNYGERGIQIQPNWRYNFLPFYNYVISLNGFDESKVGPGKDNISIDRINNNGDYEVNNLRWATKKQQANNKRNGSRNI